MRKACITAVVGVGFALASVISASALTLGDGKANMSLIEQAAKKKKKAASKPKCEQKLIFKCCMKGKQEVCTL